MRCAAWSVPRLIVALSGGKDSTAMALRLREVEPDADVTYLITPTGDELPEMVEHWRRLECLLGQSLTSVSATTLSELIRRFDMLPNSRARWCTRMLKIEPCIAWMAKHATDAVLCVGLRADEEQRQGLYSEHIPTRFPMREWGWGIQDVLAYLDGQGVKVPERTDCARCYAQQLGEWWLLWKQHPEIYADAEEDEALVSKARGGTTLYTFRSPQRDTWPAGLRELRERFEAGYVPPRTRRQLPLFETNDGGGACRVCRM